ncbi:Gag protease polyprotein [Hibiscus syriacus]|uniref:Gag protease polyprotein n=1 Tax=Hibiscus syriacus TaxID=106335 RepID=A0A6A2XRP7_HIBSY|nr:Gag protease polyprotein [Hibiscus syriacus]
MAEETQKPEAAEAPAEEVVVEKEKEEAAPPAAPDSVVEEKQAEVEAVEKEPKVEEKEAKCSTPTSSAKEKESKPPIEEKKEEDQPAPADTEEKTEEKAPEKVEAEASAPVEVKEEEDKNPPPSEEPAPETVVKTEVVEKAPAGEDDGAKTVEAIEESVVAVAPPVDKPEETVSSSVEPELVAKDEPKEADEAFNMVKNTVVWRKKFGVEGLLEEDLGNELEKVVFMHGFDKEGHPVCYNAYGEFQNKELYQKLLETMKSDLSINTIVQVNDLKNSPGPAKRELRQATNHALNLLQDNYPEFVAKQVFINVPWWYLAFNLMISPFLTQRTKSRRVNKNSPFLMLQRKIIKPATKHTVEFPTGKCALVWELRVVGWDVNYGAEFVPIAEDGYTVIVSKTRKVGAADETVISGSFKRGEAGKIVLTIDNQSAKKKKLLYRSKAKPYSD